MINDIILFSPGPEVCEEDRHPVSGERSLFLAERREVVLLVALALLVVLPVPDQEDVPRRLGGELGHLQISSQQSSDRELNVHSYISDLVATQHFQNYTG